MDQKKQPLVLFSGWGFDASIWQSWLAALSVDWDCILLDLPGFGAKADVYCASLSDVVACLLPQLPPSAVYVGWSLGGLVVSELIARHPGRVSGFMGLATAPCFIQRPDWSGMPLADLAAFIQNWSIQPDAVQRRFLSLVAGRRQRLLRAYQSECVSSAHWQWGLLALRDCDYRDMWAQLRIPQLYVFAQNDKLLPVSVAADCQRAFLHASVCVLPDANHALPVLETAALLALLRQFFSQVVNDVSA